ncbi:MAG: sensor histidine kinase, partial [Deltaproteobacteria bacterium]|nr:sensor histidine kinase [Deltaproteobacteria bacterium]
IITAEEEERKRIARELHDDTSQALNAFLIALDSIILISGENLPIRKQLIHVREQCMAMLKGVHGMIKDLRPPVLDDLGLESAIRWVLEKHLGEKGILFTLNSHGRSEQRQRSAERILDYEKVELVLFRVVQEAIINVSKHADAQNVTISIVFGDSFVEIYIEDDGKGFDTQEVLSSINRDRNIGLGLLGMQERVALIDGSLTITSNPGEGTKLRVHVPL